MELEIEVTYLCAKLPEGLKNSPSTPLQDIYFPPDASNPKLRIRQKGDSYELTKKELINPEDASVQVEHTVKLTKAEFNALACASSRKIQKRRYFYSFQSMTFEFDVFEGEHAGLVLAEVEFPNKEAKEKFRAPDFCLCDVTQENLIAGGILSGVTGSELFKSLSEKYHYKRL